jgi:hypothetical protein
MSDSVDFAQHLAVADGHRAAGLAARHAMGTPQRRRDSELQRVADMASARRGWSGPAPFNSELTPARGRG